MGLLMDFIGGAADAGSDILKQAMAREAEEEKEKRLAQLREQMEEKRMRTAEAIRRESEQLNRKQDAADYEKINAGVQTNVDDRIRRSPNVGDASALTPDQLATIKASPRGLIHNNAAPQNIKSDMASMAMQMGRSDMAKEFTAQADRERQLTHSEITAEDTRAYHERSLDNQEREGKRRADHDKAVLGHQQRMEQYQTAISPAAKLQIDIFGNAYSAATKHTAEASKALQVARNSNDPAQISEAQKVYDVAVSAERNALKQYNETAKAHLGSAWKDVVVDKEKPAPAELAPPKVGDIVDGKQFKGGNPRDASNWTDPVTPKKDQPKKPSNNESGPTYEKWLAAKQRKEEVLAAANKMSKERRQEYLDARLAAIEAEIKANENYARY